jgi:hypothetical protein
MLYNDPVKFYYIYLIKNGKEEILSLLKIVSCFNFYKFIHICTYLDIYVIFRYI